MDAGRLDKRLGVLELRETAEGWEWAETGKIWAHVELTGKSNLFSKVGIGARDALITIRKRALSLHQALRWGELHLFLTEITEPEKGWMEVHAALVEPVTCRYEPAGEPPGPTFPGIVAEKYLGHVQEAPMAYNVLRFVLVTPKAVELKTGRLVALGGPPFEVKIPHELDSYKNEYEVERTVDA